MEEFIDPSFLISVPRPTLSFPTPQPLEEPIPPPFSHPHIQFYCETNHHVIIVRDLNSPLLRFRFTQTNKSYGVYLLNQPQVEYNMVHVLSNWEIPANYDEYMIDSTLIQLGTVDASLPTPCKLRVQVDCHKVYCPDRDALSMWCMMRLQESLTTYSVDAGMIPASESAIKSMVVRRKMKKDEVNKEGAGCSVCLEEFVEGSVTGCMPCSHMFHEECITNWLRRSHNCPLCRFELPPRERESSRQDVDVRN